MVKYIVNDYYDEDISIVGGLFDTSEEAFECMKNDVEEFVKTVNADKYDIDKNSATVYGNDSCYWKINPIEI